jgi:hypothetical protein
VGLVGLVDPATPVGLADPAGRVTVVDPGDMNRVVAATVGTAVVMAPADLASRAVPVDPVVRVGMTPVDPVDRAVQVGTILGDPAGRLRAPNPVVREGRLRAPNPVVRVDPGNREATDLSLARAVPVRMPALPVRMPTRLHLTAARRLPMPALLHLTAAGPVPMPALLHLTPADRRWDPTTRAVATCPEATRAVAIRRAETRRAEAIHPADPTDPRPSSLTASRGRRVTVRTGACNRSRTLVRLNV